MSNTPNTTYIHPAALSDEQRKANLAAMHGRIANAMSRVAADEKQSKRVRAANSRDAITARRAADSLR